MGFVNSAGEFTQEWKDFSQIVKDDLSTQSLPEQLEIAQQAIDDLSSLYEKVEGGETLSAAEEARFAEAYAQYGAIGITGSSLNNLMRNGAFGEEFTQAYQDLKKLEIGTISKSSGGLAHTQDFIQINNALTLG